MITPAVRLPPVAAALRRIRSVPVIGPPLAERLHRRGVGVVPVTWPELAALVEAERPRELVVQVFDACLVPDPVGEVSSEPTSPLVLTGAGAGGAVTGPSLRAPGPDDRAGPVGPTRLRCRPVPEVAGSLCRIRRAGTAVTLRLGSDLPRPSVEEALRRHGIGDPGDRVIHPADADRLPTVEPDRPSEASLVWYVGDQPSTPAGARRARRFVLVTAAPTRYESAMAARPGTAGPLVAAAAHTVRLEILSSGRTGRSPAVEMIGAQVAGQAIGAFLLWTAAEARRHQLRQLWFLSRDGELPMEMARAMPADHWRGTRLGYLHCSRWTWQLAAAATEGVDRWMAAGTGDPSAFIHQGRHQQPLVSILGRLGLEMADLERTGSPLSELPPWEPLPESEIEAWEHLLADPATRATIEARAQVRRALIADYLGGLGLAGPGIGLVDVGWRGRLAWAVSSVVRDVAGVEPIHLHVGGHRVLPDADAECRIERFAYRPTDPAPAINPVVCVETLTASGRARVVDYDRRRDGTVRPVLEREVREVATADRRRLWAGAVHTARLLPSRRQLTALDDGDASLGAEARAILDQWWGRPRRDEVEALRGLAFESDDDGRDVRPLVAPYSAREWTGDVRRHRTWREGSAAITGPAMAVALTVHRVAGRARTVLDRARGRSAARIRRP